MGEELSFPLFVCGGGIIIWTERERKVHAVLDVATVYTHILIGGMGGIWNTIPTLADGG